MKAIVSRLDISILHAVIVVVAAIIVKSSKGRSNWDGLVRTGKMTGCGD